MNENDTHSSIPSPIMSTFCPRGGTVEAEDGHGAERLAVSASVVACSKSGPTVSVSAPVFATASRSARGGFVSRGGSVCDCDCAERIQSHFCCGSRRAKHRSGAMPTCRHTFKGRGRCPLRHAYITA